MWQSRPCQGCVASDRLAVATSTGVGLLIQYHTRTPKISRYFGVPLSCCFVGYILGPQKSRSLRLRRLRYGVPDFLSIKHLPLISWSWRSRSQHGLWIPQKTQTCSQIGCCGNRFYVKEGAVSAQTRQHPQRCPACHSVVWSTLLFGRIQATHNTPSGKQCPTKSWLVPESKHDRTK